MCAPAEAIPQAAHARRALTGREQGRHANVVVLHAGEQLVVARHAEQSALVARQADGVTRRRA